MSFARLVLTVSAVVFAGIGSSFLAKPDAMAPLVGISLTNVTAHNDVRAVFGGLQLGVGTFLIFCAVDPNRVVVGLVAQILLFAGLAWARAVSLMLDGEPGSIAYLLWSFECIGLTFGVAAFYTLRRDL